MSAHINNTHFTRRQVLIAVLGNAMGMAVWGTLNLGNGLGTGVGTGQAVSAWLDRLHPMSGCMSLSR